MSNPSASPTDNTRETTAFILPLIVFLIIGSFYPSFADFGNGTSDVAAEAASSSIFSAKNIYVAMIGAQVLIALGLLIYFRTIYLKHFPLKFSWLSVIVGVVGVIAWIGLCELHLERSFFSSIGLKSLAATRPAFNPFDSLPDVGYRTLFLALRFTLLAMIVPIIEELFLRGWLVRWIENPNWEPIKLQNLSWRALIAPSVYGAMTHPGEAIAAIVWFGMVTWLMQRTGNLWDCVLAHAVTNLLLGIFVIQFSAWQLW